MKRWTWLSLPTWIRRLNAQDGQTVFAPPSPQGGQPHEFAAAEALLAGRQRMPPAGILKSQPAERLFTQQRLHHAWLAVRRAGGGAGVDGVTLREFGEHLSEELEALRADLIAGRYQPRPIRQVLVPKRGEGLRPIAIWALRDRVAQRVIYDIIAPSFEAIFLPCSFGFRPGQSVADAVQQVLAHRDANLRWIVDGDIQNCFDSIDSRRLLGLVRKRVHDRLILHYIRGWLHAQILNSMDGRPRRAGASQGSVLSPLLANIYLHEFDRMLTAKGLAVVRYADDFVVCCRRKSDAVAAQQVVIDALARLDLTMHEEKSQIVHIDQGFSWLGYFFVRQECYRV